MHKNYVFSDVLVNHLFVTGPANTVYAKVDDEGFTSGVVTPNGASFWQEVPGGHAINLAEGTRIWIPANRCVLTPTREHLSTMTEKLEWRQLTKTRQEQHA